MSTTKRPAPRLVRAIDAVSEVCGYLSGVCIALATLVICYAVAVRAAGQTTIWQTELSVYLLIFVTFVGGAYGLKHGSHVNVDLLVNRLPRRARRIVELIGVALVLFLLVVVLLRGFEMWLRATTEGWRSGSAWNPSLSLPYAILPLGMALLTVQYLTIAWEKVRDLRDPVEPDGAVTPVEGQEH